MTKNVKVVVTGKGIFHNGGDECKVGDEIEISEAQFNFLVTKGKVADASSKSKAVNKADKAEVVANEDEITTNPEKGLDPKTGKPKG